MDIYKMSGYLFFAVNYGKYWEYFYGLLQIFVYFSNCGLGIF